ncbi:MAG: peroxidase [Chloroflexi bacterium]|nr:MAG: peroxidase [Chloroflexota bacterium]MBL1196040.1 peroxidase [Chloroflexota bacterium]NOH13334.1 peroxidase [Chloroflexota bacterium]
MHAIINDWSSAPIPDADKALCKYAEKLTLQQHEIGDADLDVLRSHGFDDRAIHDATQVISYFNYITRIADALDVEPESFIQPWGEKRKKALEKT